MSAPATATDPFRFIGCVELRQSLDQRATDERELLDRLEDVPAGSIFYHTHGYCLRHRPITTAYGNDFAAWVATQVRDQVLAERLAVVMRREAVNWMFENVATNRGLPTCETTDPRYAENWLRAAA